MNSGICFHVVKVGNQGQAGDLSVFLSLKALYKKLLN